MGADTLKNEYGFDWLNAKRDASGKPIPPHYGSAKDLGSEMDLRIDWTLEDKVMVYLRYGAFKPGVAAGYLINGTEKYQQKATELRLGVRVPIPEFSLGG